MLRARARNSKLPATWGCCCQSHILREKLFTISLRGWRERAMWWEAGSTRGFKLFLAVAVAETCKEELEGLRIICKKFLSTATRCIGTSL